ncbi:pelargonidin 3-O-(6-caffeoylglucoside) 5-O-(6-O-malonylglucoside) 4'''-malonyltransferase-like [Coffea arabica]|uniref:Pelargonidin 3-O-(6-caffeoylglucoside) 5-O-(6-O-malonylglucoside) 4'''-malonyltransferase-like n=1 Tax=Coffea arabica TaxID=13443 RepID=A0A6P6W424_COFAR|nr:pelargonidin 3-O-(6-caffeoylglucoside) 5-O-(6-O-malonylglucoside) 4'''-malonyltransferase-like [Coffea arabica]
MKMMMMEVKVLSRKLIQPSTPTPHDLRNFRIAFTDEMSPTANVPLILYYVNNSSKADDKTRIKQLLETSLAQVLPQFYPLAGRYVEESRLIDCRDQGVHYAEAQVLNCHLHQLLGPEMKPEQLNDLLPCPLYAVDGVTDPLLSIQVSTFECGGMAIGVCISHRIADAATLGTFLCAWADACSLEEGRENVCPVFNSSHYFPGRNLPKLELRIPQTNGQDVPKILTRRFVFDGRAISKIRSKVLMNCENGTTKHQYTRVQLVSGLFIRALLGLDRAKYGRSRASLITHTVNLRNKTSPPIPKHSCGNFCTFAVANCAAEQAKSPGLQGTVNLVGDAVRKTAADCARILNSGEDGNMVIIDSFKHVTEIICNSGGDLNVIMFTSWCRFPLYEVDFGWGKPIWISPASIPAPNSCVMMDTKDGDGIEAWLSLDEKDMYMLQQDHDITTFTAA